MANHGEYAGVPSAGVPSIIISVWYQIANNPLSRLSHLGTVDAPSI
jgi:hypothetical protein